MEIKRFNQLIISHSYNHEKTYNDLVISDRNNDNKIEAVHFNMNELSDIAGVIVNDLENTYTSIEEGTYKAKDQSFYEKRIEEVAKNGIISKVPLIPSLSILPLSIPIQFKQLTYIGNNIKKEIKNYGVNHIMIEIYIEINMNFIMIYPFFQQYETYTFDVPVLLELYEGQIPQTFITKES